MKIDIEKIIEIKKDIRIAGYIYYKTDLLPKGTLNTAEDAKPICQAIEKLFPELKITKYYIDAINYDFNEKSQLTQLYEACIEGKYDMIVFPSIYSLRNNSIDLIREVRQFTKMEKPPILYFLLENLDSTYNNFSDCFNTIVFGRDFYRDYRQKRKRFKEFM